MVFFWYKEGGMQVRVRPKVMVSAIVASQVWDFIWVFLWGPGIFLGVLVFLGVNAKLALCVVFCKIFVRPEHN